MRKQTKLVAVLSAAALLAIGASMTSFAATGWAEEDGTWVYLDKDGDRTYDTWKKSGNQHFYLDENGEMATERIVDTDGEKYYVDANGAKVVNAWISVDNEDGVTVDSKEVDTLWYYFGSNGKATRATSGDKKVKELSHGGGKAKFIFDNEGHMLNGWTEVSKADGTDLYYLGDENQGWALTGWQQLEPSSDANEAYDDLKWFYFDGGKAVKGTNKYIKGSYYSFNSDGTMYDGWHAATPPELGSKSYADGSGALGLGWVYTTEPGNSDSDSNWYYLVNARDNANKVARALPYNFEGNTMMAKSIKSKTYLFDTDGKMLTGIQEISTPLQITNNVAKDGKALGIGTYYFSKGDGSVNGQMVKGKATVDNDGENEYYYFDKTTGVAVKNEIKDGCLYGTDGRRINAEDGNNNSPYVLVSPVTYKKGSAAAVTLPIGTKVIVSSTGRVKESGDIKIEDITYTVSGYKVTLEK